MSLQRSNAKNAILRVEICKNAKRPPVRAGVLVCLPIQAKWLALEGCFTGDFADVSTNNAHIGEVAVALVAQCSDGGAVLTPVSV
jgi:hypothetical protein